MTQDDLKSQIALGEDSRRQFKQDVTNADALAVEGGVILLGVADDDSAPGLSLADVARLEVMA